jgi:predicted tellurium resistance membrane protein TerC
MAWIANPEIWIGLATLTALEIVLGIDNLIFISILAGKLPENQQRRARQIGLSLAMLTRIALLFSIAWITGLTEPLFAVFGQQISGKDLILIGVIIQIMLLDIVFSLDSVITAVGMVREIWVMVVVVIIAVAIMLFSAEKISNFVNRHPTVKILALSFLLLIGTSLIIEGLHVHIPKSYIYFAMGFSVFVEMLNLRLRTRTITPVKLRADYLSENQNPPNE